jgi:hypothetical protein
MDRRQLARNFLCRMIVYATGGEVGFADRQEIERILDKCKGPTPGESTDASAYPVRSLIEELVASDLFLSK